MLTDPCPRHAPDPDQPDRDVFEPSFQEPPPIEGEPEETDGEAGR